MLNQDELREKLHTQHREAEENDAKRRAQQLGLPYLNLISTKVPTEIKAMELVKEKNAKEATLVPLQLVKKKLLVAMFNPEKPDAVKIIENLKKNYEVETCVVSVSSLNHAWTYYQYIVEAKEITGRVEINEKNLNETAEKIKTLSNLSEEIKTFKSPYTSQVLEIILAGALSLKASDIHMEPGEETNTLRLRIDGLLHTVYSDFASLIFQSLVTRIKLLSSLKLNIHNQPQDGRFTIVVHSRDIEIRTSVIPSEYGETIVMRLLDPSALKVNLEELGFRPDDLQIVREEIEKPNGLILNTGPTGSGKTTTLYAFLKYASKPEIKIITIEDPIEYHLENISQTQVNSDANYTFGSGLRSILRQDPDIILVGEIRDEETAEIALNASLTGHLVLSTLHTNDAVGAIPRLIDLGAKAQVLGPSLSLIIAQRLVRKLCENCKEKSDPNEKLREKIKTFLSRLPKRVDTKTYETISIFKPKGCEKCAGLGYKGRTSIFELFVISEEIEALIYKNPTEIELKAAVKEKLVTMQNDGILKTILGATTLEEVERLTGPLEW